MSQAYAVVIEPAGDNFSAYVPDLPGCVAAAATREAVLAEIEAAIAQIDENRCSGCQVCIELCPYKAISFDAEKKVSRVNEALCKGCGTCVAACPSAAIKGKHFTTEQILSEIEGVLA